jgi:hypothetical protein
MSMQKSSYFFDLFQGIQLHSTIENRDHFCFCGYFHGCLPGRAFHRKEL